ncbi:MAG: type I-E CRISPR-associated protein Cse2/CasB [Deltaproteobacteria bacterium]|nr:type I-E CRISPR-associated protein Cse2/CasB [Deltaproteobacteria bacterium]
MNDEKNIDFREQTFREILMGWWQSLEMDTGGRAELRRAKSPDEVYVTRPFQAGLIRSLRDSGYKINGAIMDRLATSAGLMAHLRSGDNESGQSIPEAMAAQGPGNRARVSGLRFRRLMSIGDRERNELFLALLRLIRLLKRVNVLELAEAAYWWNDRIRKTWAVEYYSRARDEK